MDEMNIRKGCQYDTALSSDVNFLLSKRHNSQKERK